MFSRSLDGDAETYSECRRSSILKLFFKVPLWADPFEFQNNLKLRTMLLIRLKIIKYYKLLLLKLLLLLVARVQNFVSRLNTVFAVNQDAVHHGGELWSRWNLQIAIKISEVDWKFRFLKIDLSDCTVQSGWLGLKLNRKLSI